MNNTWKRFASETLCEEYYAMTHKSGLRILVFPKRMSSTYAILGTNYGSIDNAWKDGEAVLQVPDGIAHFLEHKLFANEDGSDSFERFSAYGADANAYTSFNKTAYLFSCTEDLEASLEELVRFVTHPYFTEESVAKERGIIAQEIGMYDDSPAERCYYGMLEGMYESHSIRRNICGSEASIGQITPALLYACYERFYDLENMALVVCGDVTPDHILSVVDPLLPSHSHGFDVQRINEGDKETRQAFQSRVTARMQVAKPLFNIGFKDVDIPSDPVARQKRDAAMAILNEILFSRAGELYNTLFESGMISPEMSYGYTVCDSFAYNSIAGEAENPEAVLHCILSHLDKCRREGLSYEDFTRGKRVMYAEFVKEFDSVEAIANNLLASVFDGYELFSYAELIASVRYEDVCALLQEQLSAEQVTLSVILPTEHD